ncbi:hypothetical protein C1Y08_00275 [Pseudomonas sp. FW306-02-F02-AA]|uniref:Uncharacterized protein n=1 Tax=Pseudomonas fluorescens TaxID=294 RepID=A0A0N9VYI8_PSEFL|nr:MULTISPECIES: hypothetical protein [Pseudomonas]ALI03943.1 hypothetical protein AO353_23800 [Pseudomonas fluorescens]PMZ04871.1 hypothetical protein C1Y07_07140 [Pseudomonas sp. FW306-02-F02-AB]PMZ12036.1 hypothetical protein C1Y06_01080 [Pseudomonas sp. FW306-02-H06C]PMZ17796.1 hypothetical protein C1Y08_00275 [Pseudomonas sp. FW306-02-F02-AA]PMZ23828.1 hypothetical protein C1Y09_00275 [Pseudomonas sp. FW306-02-F08-AA]
MTIGYVGGWTSKAGLLTREGETSSSKPVPQSVKVKQMLALVGNDPLALNTAKMSEQKLYKNFKGFDPETVTVKQPGNISAFLRDRGLISDVTALTLLNAGDKFDRFGGPKNLDEKFNALEYFATQLDNIQSNDLKGNKYANHLIPEYKKAIYVLQNLKAYGTGNGPAVPNTKGVTGKA